MTDIPETMQAIVAREPGGAEVLVMADRPMPAPGAGEVLLRVLAAGINRPDIMQRQGIAKPAPGITDVLGLEACGEVIACGPAVDSKMIGRRLMALLPGGGYAPFCTAAVDHAFVSAHAALLGVPFLDEVADRLDAPAPAAEVLRDVVTYLLRLPQDDVPALVADVGVVTAA